MAVDLSSCGDMEKTGRRGDLFAIFLPRMIACGRE
jgi:hypothetical protein